MHVVKENIIRRRKPYSDGLYVKGCIEGTDIVFTTDTGATKTIISEKVYNSIPREKRPKLMKSACLKGAGGYPLDERGKAIFQMSIGPIELEKELIVADIQDEGLLGIYILRDDEKGPADILLSKSLLILRGQEIPCIQVGVTNKIRKVTAADHVVIPPQSEAVLDVYIEHMEADDTSCVCDFIVEPTEHCNETYPLKMASTLVDLNSGVTNKIRVLKPFPTAVSINQDAVIAQAQKTDRIHSTVTEEDNSGNESCNVSVRRVELKKTEIKAPKVPRHQTNRIQEVSEHLQELFKRSTLHCSDNEKRAPAELLHNFQITFSKNEWDLGLTNLAEHSINTGDAQPIKQPQKSSVSLCQGRKAGY